jgi:AbrB family looped-hinge helix DNA binding protein
MVDEVVKVTRNFQVTIPASVRKKLGIEVGDYLLVSVDENGGIVILRKLNRLENIEKMLDQLPSLSINWVEAKSDYYEAKGGG